MVQFRKPNVTTACLVLNWLFSKTAREAKELNKAWFGGVMQIINNITVLSIVLTGAALIRERDTGLWSICW